MNDPDSQAYKGELEAHDAVAATSDTGRNSLFGVLAVHNGFIDQDTLEAAKKDRETDTSKSLGDILVRRGDLLDDDRAAIDQLLTCHLAKHDNNPQQSFSSLSISPTVSLNRPSLSNTASFTQKRGHGTTKPKEFGDYELLDEIASGGMGVVYKAQQKRLNRLVAVKMIRSGEFADEQQVKRFYTEAEAAANLDHPGIVPVYEVGEQNGQHYYSMAYVEGQSLHDTVKDDGLLPPKEAATMIRNVAEAVHFAHGKGVVHRDIKPQNVLLDSKGQPRVTDFGLAKQLHVDTGLTATGQIMGTPSYMAPEQAAGRLDEVGPISDVYSLGATLYYLLAGRPPFQAASSVETLQQVLSTEPVPVRRLNPAIPRDLETICLKCLRKESGRRYSSASELAEDLDRWLANKPIVARPVGRREKVWLWCKRRPAVASLLVALVVLAIVGTLALKVTSSRLQAAAEQRENQLAAEALVERLITAETEDVPRIVDEMQPYWDAVVPLLKQADDEAEQAGDAKKLLHIRLALVRNDSSHLDYLFARLLSAKVDEVPAILTLLSIKKNRLGEQLWDAIESGSNSERIRAAATLAKFDPDNERWTQNRENVVASQVSAPVFESKQWIEMLRPVGSVLADPLERRFRDRSADKDTERSIAAAALSDYLRDDLESLRELILLADNDREFQPFLKAIGKHKKTVIPDLQSLLNASPPVEAEGYERDALWKEQAKAAICLLELEETESVWPLFEQTPNPSLRSFIIDRIARLGANPETLAAQIREETDPASRYAMVLALGQFDVGKMSSHQRRQFVEQMAALYRNDPDSGVHSAANWTLRNWQQDQVVFEIDAEQRKSPPQMGRNWFVNSQGKTYVVVTGPVDFLMGEKSETLGTEAKKVTLSHSFAVATHEVTVTQFQKFRADQQPYADYARQPDCPMCAVSWYDAAAYCNWLSEQEGIPDEQWCYQPNEQGEYSEGMKIPADFLERIGYRLPTEEEWELVCRAGTTSTYGFGEPEELLAKYSWYVDSAESHMWPVGTKLPNAWGVFDAHGNAWELCHTSFLPPGDQSGMEVKDTDRRVSVLCGGAFGDYPVGKRTIRSSSRNSISPSKSSFLSAGFRPARTLRQN